jgi:hypothetical protein
MLNVFCDLRLAAILISAISGVALAAQTSSTTAYVHASRVALRAQPSATAPAAGYLTTNTAVDIQERSGEWCRVRSVSPPLSGFVACRFLGDAPLTLEAVAASTRFRGRSRQVRNGARRNEQFARAERHVMTTRFRWVPSDAFVVAFIALTVARS